LTLLRRQLIPPSICRSDFALIATSLAIDAGSNEKVIDALGSPLLTDQRGGARFVDWDLDLDVRVDIGAVELAISELYS
jgi:hypothetical protein